MKEREWESEGGDKETNGDNQDKKLLPISFGLFRKSI